MDYYCQTFSPLKWKKYQLCEFYIVHVRQSAYCMKRMAWNHFLALLVDSIAGGK